MLLAAIALLVGAILRTRNRPASSAGLTRLRGRDAPLGGLRATGPYPVLRRRPLRLAVPQLAAHTPLRNVARSSEESSRRFLRKVSCARSVVAGRGGVHAPGGPSMSHPPPRFGHDRFPRVLRTTRGAREGQAHAVRRFPTRYRTSAIRSATTFAVFHDERDGAARSGQQIDQRRSVRSPNNCAEMPAPELADDARRDVADASSPRTSSTASASPTWRAAADPADRAERRSAPGQAPARRARSRSSPRNQRPMTLVEIHRELHLGRLRDRLPRIRSSASPTRSATSTVQGPRPPRRPRRLRDRPAEPGERAPSGEDRAQSPRRPRPSARRPRSGWSRPARRRLRARPSSPARCPCEPEMIAPAWPIFLPGGAVTPAT